MRSGKRFFFLLVFSAAVLGLARSAVAGDEAELGIKTRAYADKGKISFHEGVRKSKQLLRKYGKVKDDVLRAISKSSKPGETPQSVGSSVLKAITPKPSAGPDTLRLKNGQTLIGVWIREKDEKGMWVEAGEGSRFYVEKEEIEEIEHKAE